MYYTHFFPLIFKLKIKGVYYAQEININFLLSYVHHQIWDDIIECKLYQWSKLTNV